MEEKIKILEHKRIIVYESVVCEDCGGHTMDYYEIKPAVLPVKTKIVCYNCINSVDSKYKTDGSFFLIDEIRQPTFGVQKKGKPGDLARALGIMDYKVFG